MLGGITQTLHIHSRNLKAIQDAVFVDPLKRFAFMFTLN